MLTAISFPVRLNSLYSIRIPFTWQSALTYPLLPPSAVIGMLANALQRYKNNNHPLEYLNRVEDALVWAGSSLVSPVVLKSYTLSAVVKWKDVIGGKFTNALSRQFAFTRTLRVLAIFHDQPILADIIAGLKTSPLTCGDSESPVTVDGEIVKSNCIDITKKVKDQEITTHFPVPFDKDTKITDGDGALYLMHERCRKTNDQFPLRSYLVPLKKEGQIIEPSFLKLKVQNEKVYEVHKLGYVVATR
jgi:CRISPR-associated Cas5-like protein